VLDVLEHVLLFISPWTQSLELQPDPRPRL
jgi:hypothetical protein